MVDQHVAGLIVGSKGEPLSGVSISYDRNGRTQAWYAPTGAVWFQDTDPSGRFHLTGLPRGPIRLMAYRRPAEADRSIRNVKYIDVPPGQTELRIELSDPNDRLRGIE